MSHIYEANQRANSEKDYFYLRPDRHHCIAGTLYRYSISHLALYFSMQLAQDIDDLEKLHKRDTYNYEQNVPFAIVLGVFAVMQFITALLIFLLNIKIHTTKAIYYCSLIGMLVSFSIGVQMTILSQEYNSMTR